jgi:acetoin utilization deacetylase AcuC-like enzyme
MLFYTDEFVLPLPPGHRFPMVKYRLLRERICSEQLVTADQIRIPAAATDTEILRAHTADYLERVVLGTLTRAEVTRIGFPWSTEMVERCRRSSGATIEACRSALSCGFGANLAGGTHHAFADAGEGFCVFNDSVIAARALQAEGLVSRVAVIDCDVHQGNGTAAITMGDESIFTFSIHGAFNFPFRKEISDLDVGLADGATGPLYLEELERALDVVFREASPDLVIYVSGADPLAGDRFGRLSLAKSDLAARDELVYSTCRRKGLPVAVSMAGGYAREITDTVDVHFETIRLGLTRLGLTRLGPKSTAGE